MGFNIKKLAHIHSFRREVYKNPNDFRKLPYSFPINHKNTFYRIFLSDDTLSCYLCKLKGHTSKQCKNSPTEDPDYNKCIRNTNVIDDKVDFNDPFCVTFGDP